MCSPTHSWGWIGPPVWRNCTSCCAFLPSLAGAGAADLAVGAGGSADAPPGSARDARGTGSADAPAAAAATASAAAAACRLCCCHYCRRCFPWAQIAHGTSIQQACSNPRPSSHMATHADPNAPAPPTPDPYTDACVHPQVEEVCLIIQRRVQG